MVMKQQKSETLDTKRVAEILGVSIPTVYRLARIGKLNRHVKPFGKVRVTYDPVQIEELRQQVQS